MKKACLFSLLFAGVILTGCATGQRDLTLDPIGPAASQPSVASADGMLTVFSGFKVNANFNNPDPNRREYSNYKVYGNDGTLLQLVQNNSNGAPNSPATVSLAPGKYRIVARANGYGIVTVPVTIVAGKPTVIHLEGGYAWPNESAFNQMNAVRLPDGAIAGWRSLE
ncbi:MAG TPA: hypothetical protein VGO57_06240 [Verrucomicrobiae bacterium]